MSDKPAKGTPEHQHFCRQRRMENIDNMTPGQRELVNRYGYSVVYAYLCLGITKPRHIKHLVETVLDEFSPTRGSKSRQGTFDQSQFGPAESESSTPLS